MNIPRLVQVTVPIGGAVSVAGSTLLGSHLVPGLLLVGAGFGVAVGVLGQWVYLRALWQLRTALARADEEVES